MNDDTSCWKGVKEALCLQFSAAISMWDSTPPPQPLNQCCAIEHLPVWEQSPRCDHTRITPELQKKGLFSLSLVTHAFAYAHYNSIQYFRLPGSIPNSCLTCYLSSPPRSGLHRLVSVSLHSHRPLMQIQLHKACLILPYAVGQ